MDRRKGVVRGTVVAAAGVAAALMLVAGAAWACTPLASIRASSTTGPVGTKVTVTGSTFDASGQQVKVWWDGPSKGQLVGTAQVNPATRTFSVAFDVPASSGGSHIISATQNDASGQPIAGSPVNTLFRVDGAAPQATPPNVQADPDSTVNEPATAAAPAAEVAASPTAASAPAAPRVRVAPARPVAPAVARATPAPAPAPAAAAPAPAPAAVAPPAAAPAPAVAPAPESAAPATAPARRSAMVSMASGPDGSPVLAIALVGIGLVLALGASAVVLAGRRDRKAPVEARR